MRVDARTGKITRRIPTDAPAAHVAAGPERPVVRDPSGQPGRDELRHYDRSGSRRLDRRTIADGVGPMALGGGSLWFAAARPSRSSAWISTTGRLTSWQTLDVAANALWSTRRATSGRRCASSTRSRRSRPAAAAPHERAPGHNPGAARRRARQRLRRQQHRPHGSSRSIAARSALRGTPVTCRSIRTPWRPTRDGVWVTGTGREHRHPPGVPVTCRRMVVAVVIAAVLAVVAVVLFTRLRTANEHAAGARGRRACAWRRSATGCASGSRCWRAISVTARDETARYRPLVDGAADWVWETDADGVLTFSNPRGRRAARRRRPRRASSPVELTHPDDQARADAPTAAPASSAARHADGTLAHVDTRSIPARRRAAAGAASTATSRATAPPAAPRCRSAPASRSSAGRSSTAGARSSATSWSATATCSTASRRASCWSSAAGGRSGSTRRRRRHRRRSPPDRTVLQLPAGHGRRARAGAAPRPASRSRSTDYDGATRRCSSTCGDRQGPRGRPRGRGAARADRRARRARAGARRHRRRLDGGVHALPRARLLATSRASSSPARAARAARRRRARLAAGARRADRRRAPPSRSSSASSAPTSASRSRCCATSTRPSSRSRARSTPCARR